MAVVAIVALLITLVMAWNRGGPQPLREIAVSLSAPTTPAGASQ
jgi:hypothetical protein